MTLIKGSRHPGLTIQTLPACARDTDLLAQEWTLSANCLVELLQCPVRLCDALRRR